MLKRQLIVVSAPAGYWKKTCYCDGINTLNLPIAWLTLESAGTERAFRSSPQ